MNVLWIVVAAVCVAIVVASVMVRGIRRSRRLRHRFGAEYDRMLVESGNREMTELELSTRLKRRRQLSIHPVNPAERQRFIEWWKQIREAARDNPQEAIAGVEPLILAVLQARGYPPGQQAQRIADISVDHPDAAHQYRCALSLVTSSTPGVSIDPASRSALIHYDAVLSALLGSSPPAIDEPERPGAV